jgi:quercetin dioxygenase-like cupin family protein
VLSSLRPAQVLGQKGASLRPFNHLQPRNKALLLSGLPFALLLLFVGTTASSDQPREPIIHPVENANFKSGDDPTCIATALEAGDPSAGASTVLIKANKGCFVRWHFHTAEQQLMLIKGELKVDMAMMPSATIGPGGFILIPSKMKHQLTCSRKSDCFLFLTMDRPFDSTWAPLGQ